MVESDELWSLFKMKSWTMTGYWIKSAIFSLAFTFVSMGHAFSQFKAGEGLYVLVNFVPEECRAKVDGLGPMPLRIGVMKLLKCLS